MPRGDKPTTVALALKDGWVYEDTLPASITKEEYDWWFKESLVLDGVRMGPPLATKPQSTTETLEPCPNSECQSDKVAASNDFSNYYVYCPDCFLRGPRESVDHFGARWNALPRISPANVAPVVDEGPQKMFPPPAEDKLHIAICNAVQSNQFTASDILRQALLDYQPTQLTRSELIRVQQRSGSDEVSAIMVSPAAATAVEQSDEYTEISCAGCGRDTDTKLLLCPTCVDSGHEGAR